MKKLSFSFAALLIMLFSGFGQTNRDAASIPDSLKKNANAVIRFYSTEYNRLSANKYVMQVNYIVTVLNEKGLPAAELLVNYDRNSKVTSIDETIYDAKGVMVKKIKGKEINDYAYNNSFTLFSDSRVKHYSPAYSIYPFTVEYTYTLEYSSVVGFQNWHPNNWFHISTEKAVLSFITPPEFNLRYQSLNGNFEFETQEVNNKKLYKWTAANLPAVPLEYAIPDYFDILPTVLLTPDQISYEGTTGDFSSWQNYGKWVFGLIKERAALPPATVAEIKLLTDTISTEKGKIKALYQYMQKKTRYVNVSLGIGGFQPIPATEVDAKGYGDCKALSNYMRSLLNAIGIESFYTEIGSGDYRRIKFPDFPSVNQTNHVILCVPTGRDTTWLECTNQNFPFGYIGSGNSGRYGLLITAEGGVLANIPAFAAGDNVRTSVINAELSENDAAVFEITSGFKNYLYEDIFHLIYKSKEEQKKELLKSLSSNGMEISEFSVIDASNTAANAFLNIKGRINKFTTKTGNRLFVEPNFLHDNSFPSRIKNDRVHNLYEAIGYCYQDTLNLTIPENYTIEFMPKDAELVSVYGTYEIAYKKLQENKIQVIRSVMIREGNYPKSQFEEINSFLTGLSGREKQKIVLTKKT